MIPQRILVTGAEGFVGRHLCPALEAAFPQAEIIGTGFSVGTNAERLDVTDREAVFASLARWRPDICLHLAGISAIGAAQAEPMRAWAVNLHGAVNVAEAILAHTPDCPMIFISTAEVYGGSFAAGMKLDETAALDPVNLYAATKAAAEMALGALTRQGLRLLRVRPFNHTAAGQSEAFVVPAFARQIARIEAGHAPPVVKTGALAPERDFLDVRDVCAAYVACIRHIETLANNNVVNIARGQPVAIGWILQTLLGLARCDICVEEDTLRLRPVENRYVAGNADYAKRVLGWTPQISLEETLRDVLEWARRTL